MDREFWKDTLYRCLWTFAQAFLGCMTVGQALTDINWVHSLSVSAAAALYCLIKQIVKYLRSKGYEDTMDFLEDTEEGDVNEY